MFVYIKDEYTDQQVKNDIKFIQDNILELKENWKFIGGCEFIKINYSYYRLYLCDGELSFNTLVFHNGSSIEIEGIIYNDYLAEIRDKRLQAIGI